jgi:hypothetical protein
MRFAAILPMAVILAAGCSRQVPTVEKDGPPGREHKGAQGEQNAKQDKPDAAHDRADRPNEQGKDAAGEEAVIRKTIDNLKKARDAAKSQDERDRLSAALSALETALQAKAPAAQDGDKDEKDDGPSG